MKEATIAQDGVSIRVRFDDKGRLVIEGKPPSQHWQVTQLYLKSGLRVVLERVQ